VLKAPINTYFDVTPIGRILNKFSKDINTAETQLSWQIGYMTQMLMALMQTCIVAIIVFRWFILILPLMFFFSALIVKKAALSIKETVRVYSTTKSPILSYVGETISGASTIRAFNRVDDFKNGFYTLLNRNIVAMQMQAGVQSWFSIRVDGMAILLMLIIAFICVFLREFNAVIISMLLSYVLTLQIYLIWTLKCMMYI
jgi:ATP-binding cassette subfamily C (CFTR/MRP) protein 1